MSAEVQVLARRPNRDTAMGSARPIVQKQYNSRCRDCFVTALLARTGLGEGVIMRNKASLQQPQLSPSAF